MVNWNEFGNGQLIIIVLLIIIIIWCIYNIITEKNDRLYHLDAFEDANKKQKAIIVMRHAEDNGPQNFTQNRSVTLPNGQTVQYRQNRLSESGKQAANKYKNLLPQMMNTLGLSPISKVIVKEPPIANNNYQGTPNPFDTVLPFIQQNQIKNVTFSSKKYLEDNDFPDLNYESGSVLIVWDREGMYGTYGQTIDPNSVLAKMNKKNNINYSIPFPTLEDYVVYVYLPDNLSVYGINMNVDPPTYKTYSG